MILQALLYGAIAGFISFTPMQRLACDVTGDGNLSALDAVNRQLVHYGQHVGQIVYLAKHHRWQTWKSLSVPRRRPPAKG